MIRHFLFIGIALAVAISPSVPQNQDGSLLSLLPKDTKTTGWSKVDTVRMYRGEDLFHFIDGGADLFFEYGFRQALAIEYQNVSGESINLEVYEMNDPGAAYGVYSIRFADGAIPIDIGQEGSAHPYYIMFWKGRYYVSLAGSYSSQECRSGLEAIARAVVQNIHEQGEKPPVLEFLPKDKLLKQRYFRGFLGVATIHVFDEKDMFHSMEGAIGTYEDHTILVHRYGNPTEAEQRLTEISAYLKSDRRFTNYTYRDQVSTVTAGKNRVLSFGRSGAHLVLSISIDESIAQASCKKAMSGGH